MKKAWTILLIINFVNCYSQNQFYTFNNDSLFSETQIHSIYDSILKTIPENYEITPTIYHRITKNDTIINYLTFSVRKEDSIGLNKKFSFVFKQDSLFLLLHKKISDFKLKDLNNNDINFDVYLGKPLLINFWGINCTPCIEEIPKLNQLKQNYRSDFNFVAITDPPCNKTDLDTFLKNRPFDFDILLDYYNVKKEIFKISFVPRNIFVDKDGYIKYIQGNYPFEKDHSTGEKIYYEDNYFKDIMNEMIK